MIVLQEREDALRRGRDEAGKSDGHASHVDGMEAIDVLPIVDGLSDAPFVDVLRERQLHDKSVNVLVLVQFVNAGQQFLLRHVIFIADECRLETTRFAGQHFVFYIGFASSVVSDEDGSQVGLFESGLDKRFHLFSNLLFDFGRSGLSVYDCHDSWYLYNGIKIGRW